MILPRATLLSERSITSGVPELRGAAKAMGLVPNSALLPPQGAIAAGLLANMMPTSPRSARRST
jgi:hypothetical protein